MQGVHKGKHDCAVFVLLLRQPLLILIVLWDVLVTVDVKICAGDAEEALVVILLFVYFSLKPKLKQTRATFTPCTIM